MRMTALQAVLFSFSLTRQGQYRLHAHPPWEDKIVPVTKYSLYNPDLAFHR